jgi:hypothetical protein
MKYQSSNCVNFGIFQNYDHKFNKPQVKNYATAASDYFFEMMPGMLQHKKSNTCN